jgi:hypothetical protein
MPVFGDEATNRIVQDYFAQSIRLIGVFDGAPHFGLSRDGHAP